MKINDPFKKKFKFLHHAYLLIGERGYWNKVLTEELESFLEIANLSTCPDLWWQNYELFGIKEAHQLIEKESRRGFSEQGRFFILEISAITPEAQNALLKTFEEPAPDSHFFIIAHSAEMFLPTLRSRLIILNQGLGTRDTASASATKFLKLDLPDRLEFIQKEFLKKKEINKSAILDFVVELGRTLRAKTDVRKMTKEEERVFREIIKCQRYLQNPRSSNRLILEHLALILPN